MMTPNELVVKYRKQCYGTTDTGMKIGPVSINSYRMAGVNTSKATPMKDSIISVLRGRFKKITGKTQSGPDIVIPSDRQGDWFPSLPLVVNKTSIVRAFNGKGSLEDMEMGLTAAIATGKVAPNLEALQKMANECMGLDCNGFVGNYYRYLGWMNADGHYGPNTPSSRYAARGLVRTSYDELAVGDVLIWDSPRHIVVVHYVMRPGDYLLVSESARSLGGLGTRIYRFTGKTKTGSTGVSGRSSGTMLQFERPNGKGGITKKFLLACKVQ
jgi:hypothetical protein